MGDMIVQWSVVCHNRRCIDGTEIQIPKETPEHDQLSQRSMSVEMIDSLLKCLKWRSSFGHKINGSRGN